MRHRPEILSQRLQDFHQKKHHNKGPLLNRVLYLLQSHLRLPRRILSDLATHTPDRLRTRSVVPNLVWSIFPRRQRSTIPKTNQTLNHTNGRRCKIMSSVRRRDALSIKSILWDGWIHLNSLSHSSVREPLALTFASLTRLIMIMCHKNCLELCCSASSV